ncbi:MAG: 50S ribosomal protein L32 [Planctomycetes bacterium]|nr:50S ribosomal protein L32 [Planctomycetota bacterium]
MAVPKRRTSKSRKGTRRAHDALAAPQTVPCSRCKTRIEPHTICPECGYYRGKPVIAVEEGI